ncbi:hypothetical protein B0T16DRAFT_457769 [Cercophora newfieldiana]|uniref:Tc1-like transposase DDE domain-containing protein n=1 Tax=Cercophora newfieldiana TaxID=92897 RepID=A0AA39Y6I0_9PEZI|nr:hypothetical protein B0T16DRAFT_457769 [Cercophora newfieldiana]
MKRLREKYSDKYTHIVMEDNASAYIAKWNKALWQESGFEVIEWPANSLDLNAIEPPWGRMKMSFRKRKVPKSRVTLEADWKKQWKEFKIKRLRRYVERIEGHIKWIIRLAGGNEYQEGTSPPPLEEGKVEPGVTAYNEWLKKEGQQRKAALAEAVWEDYEEPGIIEIEVSEGAPSEEVIVDIP